MKKIQILIADDHPIVRAGLKQIISETNDMTVADEAGNGQEVLNLVRKRNTIFCCSTYRCPEEMAWRY